MHSRLIASLGLLLALVLFLSSGAHGTLISGDQDALRAIASAYPMLQSGSNAWNAADAQQACVGPWRGVVCGPTLAPTQRVVQLNLTREQLTGQIASSIFQLSALESLDLSQNSITGSMGTQWAFFSNLTHLNLRSNFFSSAIPSELGLLSGTKMLHLDLSINNLTGPVPSTLTNLVSLTYLNLSFNTQLNGSLLASIGTFVNLEVLSVAFTSLSGVNENYIRYALPSTISNCQHLKNIDMRYTNDESHWPAAIGDLSELESLSFTTGMNFPNVSQLRRLKLLDISFSSYEQNVVLPLDIGDMESLEFLSLRKLQNPTFPPSFANLLNLTSFELEASVLGPVPTLFSGLSSLETLRILGCGFTGTLPLGYWPNLVMIDASSNKFDSLPSTLPTALTSLKYLILDDNAFVGPFPDWLGDLTSLERLNLGLNGFSSLPTTVGGLVNLRSFYSGCPFVDLPEEVRLWTNLEVFILAGADFSSMPFNATYQHSKFFDIVSGLTNLQLLLAEGSGISGTIPESIGQLSNLAELSLSMNALSGSIPLAIRYSMPDLKNLGLYDNKLNGSIPAWLSEKTMLSRLKLSHNQFTGPLPSSLSELKINTLDVSHNRLSGPIPYSYGESPYIIGFDLSHNNLSGSIPTSFNRSSPSTYFSILDLSYNRLTFCPSEIQQFPFYLQTSGICDLRNQIESWTRPYDCGCNYDAFINCQSDYPLEQCVPCAGNPPSQDNFECQHGVWVLIGENPSLTNTTLIIGPTPVVIPGNLTTSPIIFQGPDTTLTVGGCASITNITVELTQEDLEKLIKANKQGRTKELVRSGCEVSTVPLSITNPPHKCASASATVTTNSGTISAIFVVDRSKCKVQWWVILLCVLLAVVVLTLAAALTWYLIKRKKEKGQHRRVSREEPRRKTSIEH